jgi:NhaA family Na+:H+ antiporter
MKAFNVRIAEFIHSESAGGMLLMIAAASAMVLANSPFAKYYDLLIDTPVALQIGPLVIAKPLLLWVNDGLMAVFFFLVGLELKRELLIGELSDKAKIALPALGAIGGMLVPALVYYLFNRHDPVAIRGWAIPAATDIAFALGILALLGSRVPIALKILLTSLAIFDDIGAIVIIAVFYTDSISFVSLAVAAACLVVLAVLNLRGQEKIAMYIFVGVIMWIGLLKSGVHATLTGVLLAMFIPMKSASDPEHSPLMQIEHDLHTTVALWILPFFAFCNSGISLLKANLDFFIHPVPLGIMLGLFLGKQLGVFACFWLAIRIGIGTLPKGVNWASLYGLATLCGVGFTMSLFIGSLAFDQTKTGLLFDERLGIILGSLLSGVTGYLLLRRSLPADSAAIK